MCVGQMTMADPYRLPAVDYLVFSQIIHEEIARGDRWGLIDDVTLHIVDDFTEDSARQPQHHGASRVSSTGEPTHGAPQLDI